MSELIIRRQYVRYMRTHSQNPLKDLNRNTSTHQLSPTEKLHERAVILFCLAICIALFLKVVFF